MQRLVDLDCPWKLLHHHQMSLLVSMLGAGEGLSQLLGELGGSSSGWLVGFGHGGEGDDAGSWVKVVEVLKK